MRKRKTIKPFNRALGDGLDSFLTPALRKVEEKKLWANIAEDLNEQQIKVGSFIDTLTKRQLGYSSEITVGGKE